MTKAKKLKILKETRKLILDDWGRCGRKHLVWGCVSCFSGIVIDYLDSYMEEIKRFEQNKE